MALRKGWDALWRRVGRKPSGQLSIPSFSSSTSRAFLNPFINAGALVGTNARLDIALLAKVTAGLCYICLGT